MATPDIKRQSLRDMYSEPENVLEIEVLNPQTHGFGRSRYTDYEVRMKTNLPIFRLKESQVRRRYSDFDWLRQELERESKIMVPPLPPKAWARQLPWVSAKDSIFDEGFIETRREALEDFINKVTGHPLAQNEKALHIFLQEPQIDKHYTPGKVRHHA